MMSDVVRKARLTPLRADQWWYSVSAPRYLCDGNSADVLVVEGERENAIKRIADAVYVFFFSSRRRHTRLQGDWSSDVCSSDLVLLRPLGFEAGAALPGEPPVRERFVRHVERLEAGPAEALLGELHLFLAEWGAVGLGRVLFVRAAVRDVRAHDDQRRPVRDAPGRGERRIECAEGVAVRHALHVPAVALEPLGRVVRKREIGLAIYGDAVVVVDPDQTAELQMAGE